MASPGIVRTGICSLPLRIIEEAVVVYGAMVDEVTTSTVRADVAASAARTTNIVRPTFRVPTFRVSLMPRCRRGPWS